MTGEKQLIAMRRAGQSPRCVWVTDSDDHYSRETAREWHLRPNIADGQYHAHLRITGEDIPDALDLRCIVGLQCHVATDRGATRFNRIFDALIAAGASAVVGVHDDQVRLHHNTPEKTHG